MEELLTLRGVARKTANIVLANGFGKVEGIPVDTHVKRLSNRIGFSSQSDPDKIEQDLMRLVPREDWSPFSYVLIDHGRADLPGEEAPMRRVPDRAAVPLEPGVNQTAGCSCAFAGAAPTGATDHPALLLIEAAPDAGVLERRQRPLEAVGANRAAAADRLGRLDLREGGIRTCRPGRTAPGRRRCSEACGSHHMSSGSCLNRRSVILGSHPGISANLQRVGDDSV